MLPRKAASITHSGRVCIVAYISWHAKGMWPIILSSVACVALTYFSTCHKRYDFQKSYWTKKCVPWFSLQLLSARFLILKRILRDNAINVHRYSCKVPVILVRFPWNLNFLGGFSNNRKISDLMKNRPSGAGGGGSPPHADRHAEANRRFWNFANALKNVTSLFHLQSVQIQRESLLRRQQLFSQSRNSPHLTNAEGSLPFSLEPL
jgi:hypothetical protein